MGKKSKRSRPNSTNKNSSGSGGHNTDDVDGNNQRHRQAPNQRPTASSHEEETLENLQFQDPFVDEYIVEEADVDDEDDEEDDDVMEEAMAPPSTNGATTKQTKMTTTTTNMEDNVELIQSWHPLLSGGAPPPEDLEMDPSAYKMYHTLSGEWPSLSFDFLRDTLGEARQRFPHTLQAVIGSQADTPDANQLTVLQLSDLSKLPQEDNEDDDILGEQYDKEDDNDDSDDDSDEEEADLDPIMEHYHLPHYGGVNRIRCMPQQTDIVATWSDVGKVYIYNIQHVRSRFNKHDAAEANHLSSSSSNNPFFTHSGHGTEGFALDWSVSNQGHLATGDNDGMIHLWKPQNGGTTFEVTESYETVDKCSVEDLQWSPSEKTVLCSAESGGYLSIYDTRAPHRAMLRHLVSSQKGVDVNVCSWNRLVSNLLATGSDDGTLSVWDLRTFGQNKGTDNTNTAAPLARFSCHKTPITSVEWHPTDESMLAVSDSVGAYVYDLSVEEDDVLQENLTATNDTKMLVADIPPQLLFCHSGSIDFKELHWHPQISSCIMTTAYSGFSVFIPSNL